MSLPDMRVKPGSSAGIRKLDPASTRGCKDKEKSLPHFDAARKRIDELQYLLWAENKRSVLVVLQAMDTGGKDGTIRDVFEGVNPQGVTVTQFGVPSAEELDHDYLWRIHKAVPARGEIGVFNRSHYESVLVERVRKIAAPSAWKQRYEQINQFEKMLTENGVVILKFFLHISKAEQLRRLRKRLEDPLRNWKLSPQDFKERRLWSRYAEAYEDALTRCSTPWAPWRIIPADRKWYRNLAVATAIVEAMEDMHLRIPGASFDLSELSAAARRGG